MARSTRRTGWRTAATSDRHELYESSVQDPVAECDFVDRVYKERRGTLPRTLREDFAGTAFASATFVKRRATNRAFAVDLCKTTLAEGKKRHGARLTAAQRNRLQYIHGDVLKVSTPPADVLVAMNFSYYIWKTRADLLRYLRAAHSNVAPGGLMVMDAYGGYESFSEQEETRDLDGFSYAWETERYNPITGEVLNHIHFRFPDGTQIKKAFTYDWRLWTLPEITEALVEAGFVNPAVYWEGTDHKTGGGNGIFRKARSGEACAGWIAYVVAERPRARPYNRG
ncbi:MAG: class I SAM-dependent methyltransferase [Phycisphaerales bacterium]